MPIRQLHTTCRNAADRHESLVPIAVRRKNPFPFDQAGQAESGALSTPEEIATLFFLGFVEQVQGELRFVPRACDADGYYRTGAVFFEEGVG
jgi:hypothetical protein